MVQGQVFPFFFGDDFVGVDDDFTGFSVENCFRYDVSNDLFLGLRGNLDRNAFVEEREQFFVGGIAQGPEQYRGRHFLAAVDIDRKDVVDVENDFHPRPTLGNYAGVEQFLSAGMFLFVESNTGGTVQLADDHAFRPIDDKGPTVSHERNFADVYFVGDFLDEFFYFAVLLVHEQRHIHFKGGRVGHPPFFALFKRVFRHAELHTPANNSP